MVEQEGVVREFGKFRLDTRKRVLWHDHAPVPLGLKEIDMLCVLTENAGEVVTKSELLDRVWAEAFVEESNLSRHVYVLRKALKEHGAGNLIETVPRRGYRFTGDVRSPGQIVLERHAVTRTVIQQIPEPAENFRPSPLRRGRRWAVLAVLVLFAAGALAVWRASSSTTLPVRSLAVMPFRLVNPAAGTDTTGLGLADVLITRLSNIREIIVRPTSSIIDLGETDSLSAGRKLNVDAVLEGTITRSDTLVRVTARLVRVSDGTAVWAEQFERPLRDELALENDISLQLVNALALNLTSENRAALTKRFTESSEAYGLYLRGRQNWNKRNTEGMLEAEYLFRSAIKADPRFALAHVGLADTVMMRETIPANSRRSLDEALEIDPDLAEAHATQGFIKMFFDWDWTGAESSFRRSLELRPGYATAHHWYATLLVIQGRSDEAKSEMHRALEIDPLSYNFLADLGQIHYFAGEYDSAEEYCRRALAINPDFVLAHRYLSDIYMVTGRHRDGVEAYMRFAFNEDPAAQKADTERAVKDAIEKYEAIGIKDYLLATRVLTPVHPNHSYVNAIQYAIIGDREQALHHLERSHEGRAFLSAFVKAEPAFAGLRSEPRFRSVLAKMGLPPA